MFDADVGLDPSAGKRLAASTTVSFVVYGAIAAALIIASRTVTPELIEKTVDVVFKAAVEPPPPTPAPRAAPSKPRPGPITPRAAAVTPVFKESSEAPKEAEPSAAPAPAAAPEPQTAGGGGSGGVGPGGGGGSDPINLPENATPPKPSEANVAPAYPEAARSAGQEGLVVLKIVVDVDGHVSRVDVMKGEEPFVSAAIAAVKAWTYSPALVAGVATPVFRIVKVPFRLRS